MPEDSSVDKKDIKLELKQLIQEIAAKYGQYFLLHLYLTVVPKEQKQLSFSFLEISKILGFDLPKSAYKHQAWWSNTKSHPQAVAWIDTDWEVTDVYLPSKMVVFCRKRDRPVTNIPTYVKNILNHKRLLKFPASQTLLNWIRFCRQVGWYFEGVVLFEKGGFRLDVFNETEQVEVEEDYRICKKKIDEHKTANPFYPKEEEK